MASFSEKALQALGDKYYVYGLIDPRNKKIFYIGKGFKTRVFDHEKESLNNPDSEKSKLTTIAEIKQNNYEVEKVIFNAGLEENEAFAAEAALINAFNYINKNDSLTNIVSGHHFKEALTVEEFNLQYGAECLNPSDIKHNILVIKINKLYKSGLGAKELYDSVRGIWRISKDKVGLSNNESGSKSDTKSNKSMVEYVFGVYNSLIVAVYKPTAWYVCNDESNQDKLPSQVNKDELNSNTENRLFFVDDYYDKKDPNKDFYLNKSIENLKLNKGAQNPITYIKKY